MTENKNKKMRNLKECLAESGIIVREPKVFSFGTYEECKSMFVESFKMVDKTIKNFEYLDEYDSVVKWMVNTDGKGLLMAGSCGRGKSVILNGVLPLLFRARFNKVLRPVAARNLHEIKEYPVFIVVDDIGQDEIVNNYGTKVDAVEDFISEAEDKMKLLLLTSNLTGKQIRDRYGERIYDRINRLCNVVVFTGKSKRK
jgi:DNA replication protein DnaC